MLNSVGAKYSAIAVLYILGSVGALLQITGGFWDVTWHALQRPETFLTPPHMALYSGVGIGVFVALAGLVLRFWSMSNGPSGRLGTGLNLLLTGSILQGSAGGFDFWWHSAFGIDGLLSPPHLMLTIGMFVNGLGAVRGLTKLQNLQELTDNLFLKFFALVAFTALWLSSVGLVYMFTLPFSESQRFNLNPDPLLGAVTTTMLLPLIGSAIMLSAIKSIGRVGTASSLVAMFVISNTLSTIFSNPGLRHVIPYYLLHIFVGVTVDAVLYAKRNLNDRRTSLVLGLIFGVSFFTLYFPVDVQAYREIFGLSARVRMGTDIIFKNIYQSVIPIVILPGVLSGVLGGLVSLRLANGWRSFVDGFADLGKVTLQRR